MKQNLRRSTKRSVKQSEAADAAYQVDDETTFDRHIESLSNDGDDAYSDCRFDGQHLIADDACRFCSLTEEQIDAVYMIPVYERI
ncbi:hypothetical protein ACFVAJ_17020 [Agromyces sp. NPDC057679]|uniref:hypothetical protein n=1 Tax=Agromyces sp. NPDC057679 TaxID=3346207 RepID=UPI00366BF00A